MQLRNWIGLGVVLALASCGVGVAGYGLKRLPNVSAQVTGPAATPPVLAPFGNDGTIATAQEWETRRAPTLRAAFGDQVYGAMPSIAPVTIVSRQVLQRPTKGAVGLIERITIRINLVRGGATWPSGAPVVDMILMTPRGQGPFPVLAGGTFCGNDAALPATPGTRTTTMPLPQECSGKIPTFVIEAIFGRNQNIPPFEAIAAAGYGLAMWHPGDIVPDVASAAEPYLAALTPPDTPAAKRTGAIAAWAWTASRMVDVLAKEARVDADQISLIGHSRHGKSALLTAAHDPRISSVWALQSGTGGAALTKDNVGEPVSAITKDFPHWFSPAYASGAGKDGGQSVDQHQLIALIAPRPVLIGAGRRDQWGDPHGSYRALIGASPAYELFGAPPFKQDSARIQTTNGPLSFYMRDGLHGIHSEDWREALAFFTSRKPRVAPQ